METDFCDWWTPERIAASDEAWLREKTYITLAAQTKRVMEMYGLKSVIELGCGAGHVGGVLKSDYTYLGIDGSKEMIDLATSRNPDVMFKVGNMRDAHGLSAMHADLVCTFAVLKHFSNEDFPVILKNVLAMGDYALIEMQVKTEGPSENNPEDGFHHTWTAKQELLDCIELCGHAVLEYSVYVPVNAVKELVFVVTKRKTDSGIST